MPDADPMLTPNEVADRLRIGVDVVREWISNGILPAVNIGAGVRAQWRISESDLRRWINARRTAPDVPR